MKQNNATSMLESPVFNMFSKKWPNKSKIVSLSFSYRAALRVLLAPLRLPLVVSTSFLLDRNLLPNATECRLWIDGENVVPSITIAIYQLIVRNSSCWCKGLYDIREFEHSVDIFLWIICIARLIDGLNSLINIQRWLLILFRLSDGIFGLIDSQ